MNTISVIYDTTGIISLINATVDGYRKNEVFREEIRH
jgi:hypothetical protein